LLATLFTEPGSEMAQAIIQAKVVPFAAAHELRLRRAIGSPPDFDVRAPIGPALIILDLMTTGQSASEDRIRDVILPAFLHR